MDTFEESNAQKLKEWRCYENFDLYHYSKIELYSDHCLEIEDERKIEFTSPLLYRPITH